MKTKTKQLAQKTLEYLFAPRSSIIHPTIHPTDDKPKQDVCRPDVAGSNATGSIELPPAPTIQHLGMDPSPKARPESPIQYVDIEDDLSMDIVPPLTQQGNVCDPPAPPDIPIQNIINNFTEPPEVIHKIYNQLSPTAICFQEFLNQLTFQSKDFTKIKQCKNLAFGVASLFQEKCQEFPQERVPIRCTRPKENLPPLMFIKHADKWYCENGGQIHYLLSFGEFDDSNIPFTIQLIKGFLDKCYDAAQKESKSTRDVINNILFVSCDLLRYVVEKRGFQIESSC